MTTTTTTDHRPTRSVELLSDRLRTQHTRVAGILEGLDDDRLRLAVLPSGWSCLGLVRHLTEGTRFWLRRVMLADLTVPLLDDDEDFVLPPGASGPAVLGDFAAVCTAGLDGVAHLPGDTAPAWWPEGWWGGWRLRDLDEVLVHLLVEISTHAGHLDAARELLDGGTWDYAQGRVVRPGS